MATPTTMSNPNHTVNKVLYWIIGGIAVVALIVFLSTRNRAVSIGTTSSTNEEQTTTPIPEDRLF